MSRCAWSRHASRSLRMSSSIAFNSDSPSSAWAVRCCAGPRGIVLEGWDRFNARSVSAEAVDHSLPEPFKFPNPNRTGCVVVGSIVFASGHGRNMGGPGVKGQGKLGKDLTVEEGYATARAVALSMLASLKQELGDLDRIKRVVRLFGMVNVAPGFDRMPEVIDGASDFFYELFGPKAGQHARTAVGMAELPHGIPVEINGEFELKA